jgi:hypothetical protein
MQTGAGKMKPKEEALKRIGEDPAPFMIRIKIKEIPDPKKYKHKDDKGKIHDLTPPEGAKKAMKKAMKVMEML